MSDELSTLRDKIAAAKKAKAPVPPAPAPADPALDGDPVAAAIAERLLRQFSGKINGEPVPAVSVSVPTDTTMSLSEQQFVDLKNRKELEAKLVAAEKQIGNLERSLEAVASCLTNVILQQRRVLNGELIL